MPVSVSIDSRRKLVITTYSGLVTDEDVARQISEIARQAPYGGEYRAITDFTQVTQFEISTEQIRRVAESKSPLEKAQRVMVAPSDEAYGTSRMFQTLAGHTRPNISVVRNLDEAYKVLGISNENCKGA
ncbi:MAG TPA: hypothetical protein VG498_07990 [Terriglobales bacterium]|nr:hypothetical protein [Terriglobales bacterium]